MSKYQREKKRVREMANEWQLIQADQNLSWAEISKWQDFFFYKAKKLGLVKEFRENGIC